MTPEIVCAQCSRPAGVDNGDRGRREWLELRSISSDLTPLDRAPDSAAPDGWTFCSPACLSVWSADLARVCPRLPDPAPAGLYLG
jgi:hypothetical protein